MPRHVLCGCQNSGDMDSLVPCPRNSFAFLRVSGLRPSVVHISCSSLWFSLCLGASGLRPLVFKSLFCFAPRICDNLRESVDNTSLIFFSVLIREIRGCMFLFFLCLFSVVSVFSVANDLLFCFWLRLWRDVVYQENTVISEAIVE